MRVDVVDGGIEAMYDDYNQLKEPWGTYQRRRVTQLCNQLPAGRRQELLETLQAQAAFGDVQNPTLLKQALRLLGG